MNHHIIFIIIYYQHRIYLDGICLPIGSINVTVNVYDTQSDMIDITLADYTMSK